MVSKIAQAFFCPQTPGLLELALPLLVWFLCELKQFVGGTFARWGSVAILWAWKGSLPYRTSSPRLLPSRKTGRPSIPCFWIRSAGPSPRRRRVSLRYFGTNAGRRPRLLEREDPWIPRRWNSLCRFGPVPEGFRGILSPNGSTGSASSWSADTIRSLPIRTRCFSKRGLTCWGRGRPSTRPGRKPSAPIKRPNSFSI